MDTNPLPIFSSNLEELRGPSFSTLGATAPLAPLAPLPAPLHVMNCTTYLALNPLGDSLQDPLGGGDKLIGGILSYGIYIRSVSFPSEEAIKEADKDAAISSIW